MSEDAQVRELVDDDRLERLRRSEDKTPREGEPAGARGAAPAGLLVAHGHRGGADGEGRGVASDLGVDRGTGAWSGARLRECGAGARGRSHAPRPGASAVRSAVASRTTSSSSSAPPTRSTDERRRPAVAGT